MFGDFVRTDADVDAIDWKGNPIRLENVPCYRKQTGGRTWCDPDEIARAELRQKAAVAGVQPRDIPLLLLFYSQSGPFQRGFLHNKYKLNKMLFYQWKELEKIGLGNAYDYDEFEKAKKGPIPKNLYRDLERLKSLSIIEVSGGPKEKATLTAKLTPKGEAIANCLWNSVAPAYRETSAKVKNWIFPLDPNTIMERVHRDYPEFRLTFQEPDTE